MVSGLRLAIGCWRFNVEDEVLEMGNFKDLNVWQCGMSLAANVYAFIKKLPSDEKFGLVDQIRRAAVSIPSNMPRGVEGTLPKSFDIFFQSQQALLQN